MGIAAAAAAARARRQLALGVLVAAGRRVDRRQPRAQPALVVAGLEARLHQLGADARASCASVSCPRARSRRRCGSLWSCDEQRHQHAVVVLLAADLPRLGQPHREVVSAPRRRATGRWRRRSAASCPSSYGVELLRQPRHGVGRQHVRVVVDRPVGPRRYGEGLRRRREQHEAAPRRALSELHLRRLVGVGRGRLERLLRAGSPRSWPRSPSGTRGVLTL